MEKVGFPWFVGGGLEVLEKGLLCIPKAGTFNEQGIFQLLPGFANYEIGHFYS
ncbi:predicted protein [Sclerotinia sclerotiorum 1980 UF-70]|uniref:Uncharacterized protein n=2 Tax=Sclerotinia sclerotiorum (strain ATCC 18683 / 1980 / Ss-1) TaxID=665079 RepID=A7EC15_SCLS1|nr:predicted protein [Sclerotinia sclerotiorum 1980 UF-70]APA08990.1 hypothetical protein sscle_04g037600 [Sclerotinia sclerotiorum 1980 UF-70]EDN99993.1 predicted protein [Sclerotinia sclerotiorum 1980 UF-70]